MTQSRATYWAWVENQRSHKANEELERAKQREDARHHAVLEAQNQAANEEAVRAHRAAEENTRLATQQAEEASKRATEATLRKIRSDASVARMQVSASNAQKKADRDMNLLIANLNNDLKQQSIDIDKLLADAQVARTEAEKDKWANEVENNNKAMELKFKEYLIDLEDQARKNEDSRAMRDLNAKRLAWEQSQKRFENGLSLFREGRASINDVVNNFNTSVRSIRDVADIANRFRPRSAATGIPEQYRPRRNRR